MSQVQDPEFEFRYRAVHSRDPRFDGWFFTAVTSTGIYCRPSCPAATPLPHNVRFYPAAAAAQLEGFRACKRCRPDATPGSPEWNGRADVVARAMRLIADGLIDRSGVPELASRLGYSARQLQRVMLAELGAGPIAVARAQRAQSARVLIERTSLPMTDVAFASGFSSIRQFNDTIREVFAMTPTELRRHRTKSASSSAVPPGTVQLRLPHRLPFCPDNLFGHLAAAAIPGVEEADGDWYRRTLRLPHGPGIVELSPRPDHVSCKAMLSDLRDLTSAIARSRWLLDLDSDPVAIDEQLNSDPVLRPIVSKSPGRRVPRCVDGAEMAIRTVVGQQISTAAARTQGALMVSRHGERLDNPFGELTHLFPTTESLIDADLPMPSTRRETLSALAQILSAEEGLLGPGCDLVTSLKKLSEIRGIGPWTLQTVAMRVLGDPDVFLESDLGIQKAAKALEMATTPGALRTRSERWRPWRSYAVQYLWSVTEHPINNWPVTSRRPAGEPSIERTS